VTIETIIPWRGGCPWRERALEFVRPLYRWPVTVAEAPLGPWCKAAAVMPAVEASPADVLVIADADVFVEGGLDLAVEAVAQGAPWAIPHSLVHRLSERGTAAVLAGADWRKEELERGTYHGYAGGGIVVAPRETLLDIPMPRVMGWGSEDEAWAAALKLLAGRPTRGTAALVHLWHPPQPRDNGLWGSPEGRALVARFNAAARDPVAMRHLIEEAGAGWQQTSASRAGSSSAQAA